MAEHAGLIPIGQAARLLMISEERIRQLAQPTADVPLNSRKITGLGDPASAQDAATKNYVDLAVQGLVPKQSVRAASTANIATLSGAMTIDGVSLVAGDRVLVKDQSTASQNGVYVVAASYPPQTSHASVGPCRRRQTAPLRPIHNSIRYREAQERWRVVPGDAPPNHPARGRSGRHDHQVRESQHQSYWKSNPTPVSRQLIFSAFS